MIKCIVATRPENIHEQYISKYINKFNLFCCYVSNDSTNPNESLFLKYNKGVISLMQLPPEKGQLQPNDILCFIHDDATIEDPKFINKIETTFYHYPNIGLVGVAGAAILPETGGWWNAPKESLRGHLMQGQDNGNYYHSIFNPNLIGFITDLVAVDGFFLAIRADLFMRHGLVFDWQNYKGYDMYDMDICLQVLSLGYKVAVIDTLLSHKSIGGGALSPTWVYNHNILIQKWKLKGKTFPITQDQFIFKNLNQNINNNTENVVEVIEV